MPPWWWCTAAAYVYACWCYPAPQRPSGQPRAKNNRAAFWELVQFWRRAGTGYSLPKCTQKYRGDTLRLAAAATAAGPPLPSLCAWVCVCALSCTVLGLRYIDFEIIEVRYLTATLLLSRSSLSLHARGGSVARTIEACCCCCMHGISGRDRTQTDVAGYRSNSRSTTAAVPCYAVGSQQG